MVVGAGAGGGTGAIGRRRRWDGLLGSCVGGGFDGSGSEDAGEWCRDIWTKLLVHGWFMAGSMAVAM